MSQLTKALKLLRKKKGVNQEEAANKIGISRAALANYETGNRIPDCEVLVKIADYYEVSCDFILRGIESEQLDIHSATGLSNNAINVLKSNSDVGNTTRQFINYVFSDLKSLDAFYFFCRRLITHGNNISRYTESIKAFADIDLLLYGQVIEKDGKLLPVELSQGAALEYAKILFDAKEKIEASEYGLQKETVNLLEYFCKKEIMEQKKTEHDYNEGLRYLVNKAYGDSLSDKGIRLVDGGIEYDIFTKKQDGESDGDNQETE